MNKLISVIILSYRNVEGIYETLDSIFPQTYPEIEIVLSDDASDNFAEQTDKIISYVENNNRGNIKNVVINAIKQNGGTVKNINSAISRCGGEYIKILSAEDGLAYPEALSDYEAFMESADFDICFGKMRGVTPSGDYVYNLLSCESDYDLLKSYSTKQTLNRLYKKNFLPAPAWFAKKSLFEKHGLIPEDTRLIEDYPYWIYLSMNDVPFGYIDKVTIDYKMSGETSSGVYGEAFMKDMLIIYGKYIFPNDKRFGILQPIYNLLKRGGLNFYVTRAKWNKLSFPQKLWAGIKYFPFYLLTEFQAAKNNRANKKAKKETA